MSSTNATGTKSAPKPTLWGRRDFLNLAGWGAVLGSIGVGLAAFGRFMFPRVLFEPSQVFKAGLPTEYPIGEVDTRWVDAQRVWIVREAKGFYAVFAKCTHLGCTPRWLGPEDKFKCPCHGSGFRRSGVNFEGPAPRPLDRLKIVLADDGEILVDKSVGFRFEKGEWDKPGSYLYYS
ncbi:MAG: Rieske (2Fe-2S) protein [Gemmatimonadetes bacterium]|nr:Rieske (2Fe-2S) protein [Gemmatimonadota bacterium]